MVQVIFEETALQTRGAHILIKLLTRDEMVNFELARETISRVMAIFNSHIAIEGAKLCPNNHYIADLLRLKSELATEHAELSTTDYADIARILAVYGKVCPTVAQEV